MNVFTVNRITIAAGRCALEYRDGTLARVLRPGRHRLPAKAVVVRVEMREQVLTLAPQEVLTSDAVSLRVTVALRLAVTDAVAITAVARAAGAPGRDPCRGNAAGDRQGAWCGPAAVDPACPVRVAGGAGCR